MLSPTNRLPKNEINKVKKEGKLYQGKYFGVCVFDRKDNLPVRYAFVVSKKISKLAVQRNRIRRAISEAARHSLVKIPKGLDIIILAKQGLDKMMTEEIMRELQSTLRENKISV